MSLIIDNHRLLSEPTTAAQPWWREPLLMAPFRSLPDTRAGLRRAVRTGSFGDFLGHHLEPAEYIGPEGRADRDIGGVAAARHQHPTDARVVVAGVDRMPCPAEINLEPGREIHRRRVGRDADIAEIASAIARRDVHAAAEGDRQMREIATHAGAVTITFPRRPAVAGVLVAEGDMAVDVVEDRLHPAPTEWRGLEQRPGDVGQPVGLAIAGGQQEHQSVIG